MWRNTTFGLAGHLRDEKEDAGVDEIIEGLKQFSARGYASEFFDLVDDTLYRITNFNGLVHVEISSEKADDNFKKLWLSGKSSLNIEVEDLVFEDGALFLPGSTIARKKEAIEISPFLQIPAMEGIKHGIESINDMISEIEDGADVGVSTKDLEQYIRILTVANENKFIWGTLYRDISNG